MKRIFIIWIAISLILLVGEVITAFGEYICLDPGHGGPGASQYGCNGWGYNENAGSYGPVYQLSEQWVNLQVGLELKDLIIYGTMFPVIMTRWTEQAEKLLAEFLKTTKFGIKR